MLKTAVYNHEVLPSREGKTARNVLTFKQAFCMIKHVFYPAAVVQEKYNYVNIQQERCAFLSNQLSA